MDKIDYKKEFKNLYLPKPAPTILTLPRMTFISISGQGDPNGPEFGMAIESL